MSWAIWITGVPGSGKSTVARATAERLAEHREPVRWLELDAIRRVLTPHPTYSETEREVVYRALVFMAATLTEVGVPVLIDATGHRRAWRDLARASIPRFAEVLLDCSLELAQGREGTRDRGNAPAQVYAAASRPGATVPGVNIPYERAEAPDLVIDTGRDGVSTAADRVAALGLRLGPSTRRPDSPGGAVLWLTGPPGSGKTTLASRTAEGLAAEGIAVTVLEWTALRAIALSEGWTEKAEEIAHAALAYTAKLLAEAGLVVVVDAAAPRRAWRTRARTLVRSFAEVQLVCPPEVCLTRERSVRWRHWPCSGAGYALAAAPDLGREYEYSLDPDLVLDTQTRSEWTAADDLLHLARRLLARADTARGGERCASEC
jgi:adenylylsulfate kinase